MLMINNDIILFDDAALIQSMHRAGHPANAHDSYNDCNNKTYTPKSVQNISPDCNCSGYTSDEEDE